MQRLLSTLLEKTNSRASVLAAGSTRTVKASYWLFSFLYLLFFSISSSALENDDKINIGIKTVIKSNILEEEREIWVHLPEAYDSNEKYPVLYLLDGGGNFAHTVGTADSLASGEMIPELIIVGITNTNRTRDLTPTKDENRKSSGGGENFLDFIERELIPYINNKYSTEDFKIFAGHSFGGLLVMHTFHSRPNLFQAHFAFSPSLYWNNKETARKAMDFLANKKQFSNYLYMNIGKEGLISDHPDGLAMRSAFKELSAQLQEKTLENFLYKVDFFENEEHSTTPVIGQFHAFRHLYESWFVPFEPIKEGLAAIKKHYQLLSDRYGYEVKPYKTVINEAGYYHLTTKSDTNEAIALFKTNIRNFPTCANCYDSLADAYEKVGELDKAIKQMDLALKYSSNKSKPQFEEHKQRLIELRKAQ